jgi:hypothetical protein
MILPRADDALIEKLGQLESAGNLQLGLQLLVTQALPPEALIAVAVALYRNGSSAIPFLIAQQLLQANIDNWILRTISAHLGLRLNQPGAVASIDGLSALLARESSATRRSARDFLAPFLASDALAAFRDRRNGSLRELAKLWAAVEPATMQRLAASLPNRQPSLAFLRAPPAHPHLLDFEGPPAGAPHPARKVVLAIREKWIPGDPNSREHEVPIRIAAAMEAYGWQPIRYHLRSFDHPATVTEDYRNIASLCRESRPDLVILDEFQPARDGNGAPGEVIRALKLEQPDLRILGLYLDPWIQDQWNDIEAAVGILDGFWSIIPTLLWQRPAFRGRTLFAPLPHADSYSPQGPLRPELAFRGGVQYSNWYRAFWLAAIADAGLPLRVKVSNHAREALSGLDGYRAYLQETATMGATLNFSLRSDGNPTLTARTFEIPSVGALLVQERSDDVDLYFVPGRHYLRFETLTDLADIVHLLRTQPDIAETIRRAGADFFQERYAGTKIISYLDNFAFHRTAGAAAAA